ncbi:endonuclease/exonuclease/phosphatase family protein [Flavobacterium nackdongense]|uniref:Endonuclease/exonuclease/phosphatase family protein n=1 Tax=Flavobacterium nackdongense TaxID=2547394 RepID=A0A4P6Y591_9FLAO|nr:endonuclease/exonuclease/phosphatase family protein [Flavobacterium nackdongense]QBN17256.1 endonuclease/exonuclease/phosphatase family protein [Flavobacterium nackdongense]
MTIATWNLERLKYSKETANIIAILENLNADILVLTEYDERVNLKNYPFQIATKSLSEIQPAYYMPSEKRVKIYSKYEIVNQFQTYDEYTSCCAEIKTEKGNLLVYGTIIGIFGNRNENFKTDLPKQIIDFNTLSKNQNICIIGDYNLSFSDNYYFTNRGRKELNNSFLENKITNLTHHLPETIDHIAISQEFIGNAKIETHEWNLEKKLSDHKGISIQIDYSL